MEKIISNKTLILKEVKIIYLLKYKVSNQLRHFDVFLLFSEVIRVLKNNLNIKKRFKDLIRNKKFISFFSKCRTIIVKLTVSIRRYLNMNFFVPLLSILLASISRIYYLLCNINNILFDYNYDIDNKVFKNNVILDCNNIPDSNYNKERDQLVNMFINN